jgi:hypothetical protein
LKKLEETTIPRGKVLRKYGGGEYIDVHSRMTEKRRSENAKTALYRIWCAKPKIVIHRSRNYTPNGTPIQETRSITQHQHLQHGEQRGIEPGSPKHPTTATM